jgi:hypothetical protein
MPRDCGSGALQMVNECIRRNKQIGRAMGFDKQ